MRTSATLLLLSALWCLTSACGDSNTTPQNTPPPAKMEDAGNQDVPREDADNDLAEDETDLVEDAPDEPQTSATVLLPLGETLYLDHDDYLFAWGAGHGENIEVAGAPAGAEARIRGTGALRRLTPDLPGLWTLSLGDETLQIEVETDALNADTFLNYNYTPVQAIAQLDEDTLWIASPPSNAVQRVRLTPEGPVADVLVPTGSWPTSVAHWPEENTLLVAQTGRDSLGFLDLEKGQMVDAIPVGDEPAGIILDTTTPGGPYAYVSLSGANQVARVSLREKRVLGTIPVSRDPRSMVWDEENGRLFVASLLSGNASPRGLLQGELLREDEQPDIAVINTETFELDGWINAVGTIIRGLWLSPDNTRLIAARSEARNLQSNVAAHSRPHAHGLAVIDVDLASDNLYSVTEQIDLDQQPTSTGPAASPFTMMLSPDASHLVVTLSAGRAILVLDAETLEEQARIPTGHDPRGLAFAHGRVWTLAWLDNRVESFAWKENLTEDLESASVEVGNDPTPPLIKEGQRIFNDANFSSSGDFSCNNCHIDGLTDGLVWNILLDGDVNTLAFRNVGGTGPFLWGGFLPTLFDFSREVLRLVGASATGEQMQKLTTYMQSVTAPPNPWTLPGGQLTPEAERGKAVFFNSLEEGGAACGDCHDGPLFTNKEQVPGKTPLPTDVPSLIATYDTGPWGREGQWSTLESMVDYAADYTGATLNEGDRSDLLAYVQQIPGDLLYLNSSKPLNNNSHAWNQTPIEMTFSSSLAAGQENKFHMEVYNGEKWVSLPGMWDVSGRVARFHPIGLLGEDSQFRIRVDVGLRGRLGRSTRGETRVEFQTGSAPATKISGRWRWDFTGGISGDLTMAFIQSEGGKVSGVLLETNSPLDFDNVQGFVAGNTLQLEPFLVESPFGQVVVDSTTLELSDEDNDGFADRGEGPLESLFTLQVTAQRLSLPEE